MNTVFQKIDGYLNRKATCPMIVDVQNTEDLETLVAQYQLPSNAFLKVSDPAFCNKDAFPMAEALYFRLQEGNHNFFVRELASFYLLQGEKELTQALKHLLGLQIKGHVVVITWQCASYLETIKKSDPRLASRIVIHKGIIPPRPRLVFIAPDLEPDKDEVCINGIDKIGSAVEKNLSSLIYVRTAKGKKNYPNSLYTISEIRSSYLMLCERDSSTVSLGEAAGTPEQWLYAVEQFRKYPSWHAVIWGKFGDLEHLDAQFSSRFNQNSDPLERWLYFIGLKLFGAGKDTYLSTVVQNSATVQELATQAYQSILDIQPTAPDFAQIYHRRKQLLQELGNPMDELLKFFGLVRGKGANALYYMTDNTQLDKEEIFNLLDRYGIEMDRQALLNVLKVIFPDLYQYMTPFQFHNPLLDSYFQDYKYQKIINKILPEFMEVVEKQAVEREYNVLLPVRTAVVADLDIADSQSYFVDAMGAEYLGYILSRCSDYHLLAKVSLARCNLPSITSENKDFYDTLDTPERPIVPIKSLDDIKHEGKSAYNYEKTKQPIHLIEELEIIDQLLGNIRVDLAKQNYAKAIVISDHGASRLAVIRESDNKWEMKEKGQHSGRCCPKSDIDTPPEFAVDAEDYWVLANYDRFKGSRKANVEVHGGATLEEVVVPIIELTYITGSLEVKLLPLDGSTFTGTPEVKFGYKSYPGLRIYINQKLQDVTITIDGVEYAATPDGNNYHVVQEITHLKKAKTYSVDVFSCGNQIAGGLPLVAKSAGVTKKSFF